MSAVTVDEARALVKASAHASLTIIGSRLAIVWNDDALDAALKVYVGAANGEKSDALGEVGSARPWAFGDRVRILENGEIGTVERGPCPYPNGDAIDHDGDLRVRTDNGSHSYYYKPDEVERIN